MEEGGRSCFRKVRHMAARLNKFLDGAVVGREEDVDAASHPQGRSLTKVSFTGEILNRTPICTAVVSCLIIGS